jgi:hypothetical protein
LIVPREKHTIKILRDILEDLFCSVESIEIDESFLLIDIFSGTFSSIYTLPFHIQDIIPYLECSPEKYSEFSQFINLIRSSSTEIPTDHEGTRDESTRLLIM